MGEHIIDGEFQSVKYPTTPRGFVPLNISDLHAGSILWEYAQRCRTNDPDFSADLEEALRLRGYSHPKGTWRQPPYLWQDELARAMGSITTKEHVKKRTK